MLETVLTPVTVEDNVPVVVKLPEVEVYVSTSVDVQGSVVVESEGAALVRVFTEALTEVPVMV